tara:strand:+ start:6799 stop:7419 length:621 start_codon:yes stop_codon:yes gene_type:complete
MSIQKNQLQSELDKIINSGDIKEVDIGDIKPYGKNPRKIPADAVDAVKESIKEFGYAVPIVVDSDMVIVTGHTRYKALQDMKVPKVSVMVASHLSEAQAKEFRIADNKVSEVASWDKELLVPEIRAVEGDGAMDVFFKSGELELLLGSLDEAGTSVNSPTKEKIEATQEALDKKYEDLDERAQDMTFEVKCEHCKEPYHIDKRLVK